MTARDDVSVGMPLDEFMRLFEQEGPFELAGDERIPILPGVAEHSEIIKLIYALLLLYEKQTQKAVAYAETAYILTYTPEWVTGARIPDVMVYATERMMTYKAQNADWRKKPFVLVPDLCVEVISPNDIYGEVDEKVNRYLADGVRLVWVINPRTRSVQVHRADSIQSVRLTEEHTLDGRDVLPGFETSVEDLFAE